MKKKNQDCFIVEDINDDYISMVVVCGKDRFKIFVSKYDGDVDVEPLTDDEFKQWLNVDDYVLDA